MQKSFVIGKDPGNRAGNNEQLLHLPSFYITNQWIHSKRGPKNEVDPNKPYAFLVEKERTIHGKTEEVATIFLTNKECPFRCLMCDLWKNTTDKAVPVGLIPEQIKYALERLPTTRHVKLYNSGNFFDKRAIPVEDYNKIIELIKGFETVLVENHPKFINQNVLDFRDRLSANLQVAIGLETVHPEVLPRLNKQMKLVDFERSVLFLSHNEISSRAFILLKPPFLNEGEGVQWAKKSIDFAFKVGVECCSIIPTRSGNGALDHLREKGYFQSPKIKSLEEVLEYGLSLNRGRVFADLWDLEQFSDCDKCFSQRNVRISNMNLSQHVFSEVDCTCI